MEPKNNSESIRVEKDRISKEISALWRPDAEQIVQLFEESKDLVIISAPGGSGKSLNLIPQIVAVSQERNTPCFQCDCRILPSRDDIQIVTDSLNRVLPLKTEPSRVILDEAGVIDERIVPNVLEYLRRRNASGVAPIVRSQKTEARKTDARPWIAASEADGRKTAIYEFRPKLLPPKLAADFLEISLGTKSDVANFLLENFPRYPRILRTLGIKDNINEVIKIWRYISSDAEEYGLTREEVHEINEKLESG